VTSDLLIAVKLAACENINLICTGGTALRNVFSLQGSQVESFIRSLRVETTFLGADAIHTDGVVSNVNLEEALIKKAMIESAHKTILLADSSKFEKIGFAKVCSLSELDLVITDSEISQEKRDLVASSGVPFLAV
jgi:DeoR/GlpR family transcriptional regulator of sugar metabolism